ncbi:uncharacterized protein LOC131061633 isoform X1 [Cryptomeria japonica]|uniref:uncharacterized protein LOC131061633 isoform X1 n=1 Tax=Cryptomeria japonica TaxID=3369 RepID=UPI0027D9D1C8|nr:uncharacterized protein LOC131061633 isoform X1 [Cryptomeria japonica]
MGKSSVMVQTESILLKTAAQLAFTNSFQKNDINEAAESKLSVTGETRRRKIANAIERLEAKRSIGLNIIDNIYYSVKQAKNFTAEVSKTILLKTKKQTAEQPDLKKLSKGTDHHIFSKLSSRLCKFWSTLRALWEESAPFDLPRFNKFLEKKYELKYHQILKSLAVIDRRDMFEEDEESGSGNQKVGEIPSEEYSLHGTTPSILTVQYNAWHYRNETEAWAGLAVKITQEFEATMTVAHKLRTSWIYNWRNHRDNICLKVIFPFFLAVVVAIFLSIIIWLVLGTAHNKDIKKLKYGGVPASMIVAALGLGKSVISFVKPISPQVVDYICLPDHSQKLGYHQKVIDDINFLKEHLCYKRSWKWEAFAFIWCCITWSWDENYIPGTKIPKMPPAFSDNLRIIVFVDDLDRCEENVILQVLSAVNLVLATCQINVILSMVNSMIQRAIRRKYGNNNSRANNTSNEDLADKFLRKIIQLPLHLPDPSDKESRDFLQSQLGMWDSRKGSAFKKVNTDARRKANPKFQIEIWDPEKLRPARGETNEYFAESGAEQQRADTPKQGLTKTEEHDTIEKPEGSRGEEAKIEIHETISIEQPIKIDEQQKVIEKAERVSPITKIYRYVCALLHSCNVRSNNSQSRVGEAPGIEQRIKRDKQGDQEQREESKGERSLSLIISAMLIPKYTQGEINAFHFLHARCTRNRKLPREWKCLLAYHRLAWNILSLSPDVDLVEGWQVQLIVWIFVCWEWRHLITTLIQNWNNLGILRKWKVTEEHSGPSLREIVEHYIDERWPADNKRDNIQGDNKSTTKKEHDAIDNIQGDNKSATKKEHDAIDSLSSTEDVEKISDSLPEQNVITEGDDYLREVLRKVLKDQEEMREILRNSLKEQEEMRETLRKEQEGMREALRKEQGEMREALRKEQEEMREALRKNSKEQEDMKTILEMIKKKVFEEEEDRVGEENSVQQYTTAEEREEWNRLKETLRRYNVSMDGIQAFQKFRFYCKPGYLPWPLPEQA